MVRLIDGFEKHRISATITAPQNANGTDKGIVMLRNCRVLVAASVLLFSVGYATAASAQCVPSVSEAQRANLEYMRTYLDGPHTDRFIDSLQEMQRSARVDNGPLFLSWSSRVESLYAELPPSARSSVDAAIEILELEMLDDAEFLAGNCLNPVCECGGLFASCCVESGACPSGTVPRCNCGVFSSTCGCSQLTSSGALPVPAMSGLMQAGLVVLIVGAAIWRLWQ